MSEILKSEKIRKTTIATVITAGILSLSACDAGKETDEAWEDTKATADDAWEEVKDFFTVSGDNKGKFVLGLVCGADQAPVFNEEASSYNNEKNTAHLEASCVKDGKEFAPRRVRLVEGNGIIIDDGLELTDTLTIKYEGGDDTTLKAGINEKRKAVVMNFTNIDDFPRPSAENSAPNVD